MLELADKWIWDSWYVEDQGLWHAFFLQADRALGDPEQRHWHVSHGHATSTDLVHWSYQGTVLAPSPTPAFDDCSVWTGSVVKGDDNLWHLFYTGTSHAENGLHQRIGHATSTNLHDWHKQGLALERRGPNAECYEPHLPERWKDESMRDPWVIRDPEGDGWLMFFTARSPFADDTLAAGAIGLARSPDLYQWSLEPPVFVGGFGEIEVPTVFEKNGRWYCLFCTSAPYWSAAYRETYPGEPVSGIHYLMADHPLGPWRIAEGHFLDGTPHCDRYAPRWLHANGRDWLMSCLMQKNGEFQGVLTDPVELQAGPDGRLELRALPARTAVEETANG
ncbi:levansucrase [Halomonas almeriensis]|uniref:levansucrase n=1 Tax=Halomonas almeriensis TaxID=308163 RepID=UPI0025B29136|nr:levansucrase [Halomonas almeriensis]MDN3552038.1 levansucrase [Halomonas almeriensis]